MLLAGLAGAIGVLAAWAALVAVEEARLVQAFGRWIAPALEAAGSGREPTSPERRRLVALGGLSALGAGWIAAGMWMGLALGATAPWAAGTVLRVRRRRWLQAVAADAPSVARALADAMAGGHSVRGALAETARSGGVGGPAGQELRAAALRLDLGERTEDVLATLARRTGPGPYDILVAAILLQRDAGGDLGCLLRALAAAFEERARVEGEARSVTAQARFSAGIVAGLPLGGAVVAELAQPGYLAGLASAPLPALLAGSALVLQGVALVAVRRIARLPRTAGDSGAPLHQRAPSP